MFINGFGIWCHEMVWSSCVIHIWNFHNIFMIKSPCTVLFCFKNLQVIVLSWVSSRISFTGKVSEKTRLGHVGQGHLRNVWQIQEDKFDFIQRVMLAFLCKRCVSSISQNLLVWGLVIDNIMWMNSCCRKEENLNLNF